MSFVRLLTILIISSSIPLASIFAEESGATSCLEIYKKQAQENQEEYRKLRDRHVHGEVTLSGNGRTIMLPNANITFSGEDNRTEYRNDEQIALELLNSEDILKITESEAYNMLTHLQNKLERKNITATIAQIQKVIKQGFAENEFCKDGKVKKRAGQIIRYAKKELKNEKINNSPRLPSPGKIADDFNSERDVAGKKKSTTQDTQED